MVVTVNKGTGKVQTGHIAEDLKLIFPLGLAIDARAKSPLSSVLSFCILNHAKRAGETILPWSQSLLAPARGRC